MQSLDRALRQAALALLLNLGFSVPLIAASPELVFYNGKVVTVDEGFHVSRAFSVAGNVFLQVGTDEEILRSSGPATRKIDLQGRTVIPGLMDDHNHQLTFALWARHVTLPGVTSRQQMLEAISAKAKEVARGAAPGKVLYVSSDWLVIRSYGRADWLTDERLRNANTLASELDREALDGASPQVPVIAAGGPEEGGHHFYLNSAALRLAGIDKDTPSPPGGVIQKDPQTGEPTGLLIERAMALARPLIAAPTHEELVEALKWAQREENSVGITGIREPALRPEEMRAYGQLWADKALTLRVSMNLNLDPKGTASDSLDSKRSAVELIEQLEQWGVSSGFGDRWLRLDGIGEFAIDGGFEGGLMREPYFELNGAPAPAGYVGQQRIDTAKFEQVMQAMSRLNWRGTSHVVGDAGLDLVLAAYAKANAVKDISKRRWILEHCHYTRPDQFAAMKQLGLSISTQFHPYVAGEMMTGNWGPDRAAQLMRVRDWLDAGIKVAGGSDYWEVPANPFWMIHFWVTRATQQGGVIGPEQRISREEALRLHTMNHAYLTFEEDIKGSIEPGKLADFVILSDDILTVPESSIKDIQALATFVDGKRVYKRAGVELPGL